MTDEMPLPKGMNKVPEQFIPQEGKSMSHENANYSMEIRVALRDLEYNGILVSIKKLEILEQENAPALVSIIAEVKDKSD